MCGGSTTTTELRPINAENDFLIRVKKAVPIQGGTLTITSATLEGLTDSPLVGVSGVNGLGVPVFVLTIARSFLVANWGEMLPCVLLVSYNNSTSVRYPLILSLS